MSERVNAAQPRPAHSLNSKIRAYRAKLDAKGCAGTLRMSVMMAPIVGAVLCLDLARMVAGLAVRMYEAAPHILPNLLLKLRWVRAQRNLEVSASPA